MASTLLVLPREMETPLILAVDIGSSSVRLAIFDRLAREVAGTDATLDYTWAMPEAGAAEVPADALLELLFTGIDRATLQASELNLSISGVAISTLVSNVMGIGKNGRPLTPVYLYADTRASAEADDLRAEVDEASWHDRTGCRIHSSYLPARLRWLARVQPDAFRQAQSWMSIGEYLFLRLFGERRVSTSVASWSGLLNRNELSWDEEVIQRLSLEPQQLSTLVDFSEPSIGLSTSWRKRWPSLAEAHWYPAVGDGATANLGSHCFGPRRMALSLGTSAALRVVTNAQIRRLPPELWCYRVDRTRSLPGGALSEGGNVYSWLMRTLRLEDDVAVEVALSKRPPDGHGLTFLPFLMGERSPGWAVEATGAIHGITMRTTPIDVLQAGLEAVALRLTLVYHALSKLHGEPELIVGSGGAIQQSPVWAQIIADSVGQPLVISSVMRASLRGAALLALETLGAVRSLESLPDPSGRLVEPNPTRHERYAKALERQRRLYRALVGNPKEGL